MLSWYGLANIAQENYLCNVGPEFKIKFAQIEKVVFYSFSYVATQCWSGNSSVSNMFTH